MPTFLLLVVRRAILFFAVLNIILIAIVAITSFNDFGDYNRSSLLFQQLILNFFILFAALYALSTKRQERISASASVEDRNKEWTRRRRALFTAILAIATLFYTSIFFSRFINTNPPNSNGPSGFRGCDTHFLSKEACAIQFYILTSELVCVVLMVVEGVFTYREHGLREQIEREQEQELQRIQNLPPVVIQYQPDLSLSARARTRAEAVPGMAEDGGAGEEEVEELPEYERHPKPQRGRAVVVVDMTHLEATQQQAQQEAGASGLPNYETVVEMPERAEETEAPTAAAPTTAAEGSSSMSTASALDPLSQPNTVAPPQGEPSAESGLSAPTAQASSSSSSTEPVATQSSPASSSLPRLPSYRP